MEFPGHVWNGPGFKIDGARIWRRHECGHVSGLLARHHGRWPRWVPRMTSKHFCGIDVPLTPAGLSPFVGSTDRHLLLSLLPPWHRPRSGCCRLPPVCLAARHHRPDDPGGLVGQSDRRDLARPALQQLQQPGICRFAARLGVSNHRHRADDQ